MSRHIKLEETEYEELKLVLRSIAAAIPDEDISTNFLDLKNRIDSAICYQKPSKTPPQKLRLIQKEIDDRYAAAVARLWIGKNLIEE